MLIQTNNKGLQGESRFGEMHPAVIAIYYILLLVIIMISNSPVFLIAGTAIGLAYDGIHRGFRHVLRNLRMAFFIILFVSIINGFFTHNGGTVLFYIGAQRITLESFLYGANMSLVIIAAICWFGSFNVIMTSDKLIHVFGKLLPVIGLVISMVFRFIPLLQQRLSEIQAGQIALGKNKVKGPINRIRQYTKEISTLISWSLEASIESADSMSARGYGLKGRTSYSLFKIGRTDILILCLTVVFAAGVFVGYHFKIGKLSFYPFIVKATEVSFLYEALVFLSFLVLMMIPLVIDVYGELKWKRSLSKI